MICSTSMGNYLYDILQNISSIIEKLKSEFNA